MQYIFCHVFGILLFMQCSASAVQCLQIVCGAVHSADRTLAVRAQCIKSVPATSLQKHSWRCCHVIGMDCIFRFCFFVCFFSTIEQNELKFLHYLFFK